MSGEGARRTFDRYRALLEAGGSTVFWTADPSGHCEEARRWMEAFTGVPRSPDEPNTWWVAAVHPEDRARVEAAGAAAVTSRGPFAVEFRLKHHTGEWRDVALRGLSLFGEDGAFREWVGLVLDITERRRTERELRELTATLEQRVAERTLQLRSLAQALTEAEERERRRLARLLHDHLQQLLVAAKINLVGLRPGCDSEQTAAAVTRMESVLEDAIEASRSLAHELSPPVLQRGGLAPALEWLGQHTETTHGLPVEVRAEVTGGSLPETIRVFLFQAARELVFNVVKHARASRVELELRPSPEGVLLTVADDGAGCAPARPGGEDSGGFGLFGISERAALLGGLLTVESAPGRGTRATVTVPLQGGATVREPAPAVLSGSEITPAARLRVLLADDHAVVREGLRSLLEEEPDIEVVGEAEDGLQALQAAHRLQPDVVVMDVTMPVLDGIAATRRLRTELSGVHVIGLSLHDDPDVEEQMLAAGAVVHLSKSGRSEKLVAALRSCRGVMVPSASTAAPPEL